jgi:predicted TPR repeat methyltransferase
MSSKIKLRSPKKGHGKGTTSISHQVALAIARHKEGHVEDAMRRYQQILLSSPDHIDALHFLGVAEHQLGKSEQALEHMARVLVLEPEHADARTNRGNILKELGRLEEAESDYRRALALRPKDPNTLNNMGTILRTRGDRKGAEAAFREVIALKPDHAPAWQNLGNTLGEMDRWQEALEAHHEAMRLAPQLPDSYHYLGLGLYAAGRLEEATEVFQRWLKLFPNDPSARHLVASCTGQGIPERASDDYVQAEFDDFAATFDSQLTSLEYHGPALVDEEVTRIYGAPQPRLVVLDVGCGTGLCGPSLRPRASFLAGVDLSPAMVNLARKRDVYDALVVGELTAYLQAHENASDLIVSADTLVYFGDLGEVTLAAAKALRPGGVLVFTVERAEVVQAPNGFRLNPHGRYSHAADYVRRVLTQAGFIDQVQREVTIRKEASKWVDGYLISARVPQVGLDPTR